jgi:hypothetical protein
MLFIIYVRGKVNFKRKRKTMTVSFTVRGGCPLGWETAIFDRGLLKNSKGVMVVLMLFCCHR